MDLLFKRYASPFSFIDGMIRIRKLPEFVDELVQATNAEQEEKTKWEFYLHRVFDKSFNEFVCDLQTEKENRQMSERTVETTIKHSMNILNNFVPDQEGGEKEDGDI